MQNFDLKPPHLKAFNEVDNTTMPMEKTGNEAETIKNGTKTAFKKNRFTEKNMALVFDVMINKLFG
jgi:hypothetical protein